MAPKNVIEHKNSDIPRIKIVINWASYNDDLNEQSVLIGPKFKNEFQIPAVADLTSLNLKPCKFTTFC